MTLVSWTLGSSGKYERLKWIPVGQVFLIIHVSHDATHKHATRLGRYRQRRTHVGLFLLFAGLHSQQEASAAVTRQRNVDVGACRLAVAWIPCQV